MIFEDALKSEEIILSQITAEFAVFGAGETMKDFWIWRILSDVPNYTNLTKKKLFQEILFKPAFTSLI